MDGEKGHIVDTELKKNVDTELRPLSRGSGPAIAVERRRGLWVRGYGAI